MCIVCVNVLVAIYVPYIFNKRMMTLYFWSFFFRNIDYDLLYFTSISIAAVAQRLESSLLVLSVVGSITKDGPSWLFSRQEFEVKWRIKSPHCYKMVLSYEYRTFTTNLDIHGLRGIQIFIKLIMAGCTKWICILKE